MKIRLSLLILLSLFLLFFHLGKRPLLSSGEARASEIAVEMSQRGNILIPYLNEQILLTKPVLFHWTIILCYKIYGISEFSSRVPSAVSGVIIIVTVFLLGLRLWGIKTGTTAGIILLTCPLFFWSARCARIDCLLLCLITLSLYCFWMGYESLPDKTLWFTGWYIFMALAALAKGPIGVAVPLITGILFLLFTGKYGLLKRLGWIRGIFIFCIIALPWYVYIYLSVPHTKSMLFFVRQNKAWLFGRGEWVKGYVYIPHLILGFFPWSLALPAVFRYKWKDFMHRKDEKTVFLFIWCILVFCIFFFMGKKVSRYILPLYPAASLLTASIITENKKICRLFSCAMGIVWTTVILLAISFPLYAPFIDPLLKTIIYRHTNIYILAVIGAGIVCLAVYGAKRRSMAVSASISFVSLLMFTSCVIPIERDYYSPKPFCNMLKKTIEEGASLRAYKSWDNTIRYYYGRHVDIMRTENELINYIGSHQKAYCFMWQDVYEALPETIRNRLSVVKSGYKVFEHKTVLLCGKR